MNSVICDAISERRLPELRYHGCTRIVEPHLYGTDHDGDEALRCFQIYGGSESGERIGWKLLRIREIFGLRMLETTFSVRPDYLRGDKVVKHVMCRL